MRDGGRVDVIYGFADSLQGGGSSDGEVGHTHIVVDGSDETDDFEVAVAFKLLFRDSA